MDVNLSHTTVIPWNVVSSQKLYIAGQAVTTKDKAAMS